MVPAWTLVLLKKVSRSEITTQYGKTTWLRQSRRAMVGDYHKVNIDLILDTLASDAVDAAGLHARSGLQKVRPAGPRPNSRSSIASIHDD